jgi:hypothetical protein
LKNSGSPIVIGEPMKSCVDGLGWPGDLGNANHPKQPTGAENHDHLTR